MVVVYTGFARVVPEQVCDVVCRLLCQEGILGHPPAASRLPGPGAPLVLLKAAWGGLCGVSLRPL
ncbi:MAG: hypothetical protein ABR590_11370, partial [Spirochaetia bacterium]